MPSGRKRTPNWCRPCGSAMAGGCSAVVMVRDDFWMAVSRFMRELEIDWSKAQNSAGGRSVRPAPRRESAGGVWPGLRQTAGTAGELTKDQKLSSTRRWPDWPRKARSSRVRLALFAEMVKGKPWTPATLKEVGGTEGVGVTFLEETFSAADRPAAAPLPPESGPGRPEGAAARSRHRHQGPHAVAAGIAGSVGLWQPSEGFRRPAPHSRRRTPPHHADRSRRQGRRGCRSSRPSRSRNTTN